MRLINYAIGFTLVTLSLHAQVVEGAGSGSLGLRLAVLEQVENNLDGLVKLLVDAIKLLDWVVVDEDVGVNAVVLGPYRAVSR